MATSSPSDDDRVYDRAVKFMLDGSIPAIVPVETLTHEGVFAVAHDFTDAPHLKANCFHRSSRRRALAAFAMIKFARKIAREQHGYKPLP